MSKTSAASRSSATRVDNGTTGTSIRPTRTWVVGGSSAANSNSSASGSLRTITVIVSILIGSPWSTPVNPRWGRQRRVRSVWTIAVWTAEASWDGVCAVSRQCTNVLHQETEQVAPRRGSPSGRCLVAVTVAVAVGGGRQVEDPVSDDRHTDEDVRHNHLVAGDARAL